MIGAPQAGGPSVSQACATGLRCLLTAATEIQAGLATLALSATCDRTSNGPHLYYPDPGAAGGTGVAEDWVMQNFSYDPFTAKSMLTTAENVAARYKVDTGRQHEVVLRREEQYAAALADDCAFLKRFMTLPFQVPTPNFRKTASVMAADEGVTRSTPEGLATLKPVQEGGTVTFGAQTHPADGNACLIVATPGKARELSRDPKIRVRLMGFGLERVEPAFMPRATVPAAKRALEQAGIGINKVKAIKLHNPFSVNDIVFAEETGTQVADLNNYGSSLVWGHPQAPMGTRSVIELIEELVIRGGGYGLFGGCAAGDTAMAVVILVDERPA
jgi:acetyl-CoA acetyltransferase